MLPDSPGFNPDYSEQEPTPEQIKTLTFDSVLEFGAPWCGHCQAATAAVQHFFAQHNELRHIKVYDGKGKRLGRSFGVKLWPTLILLRQGEEVARVIRPRESHDLAELKA